jgi:hypothetical protein
MGKRQKKLKVVLDTNALVSALLFGGEPGRLVLLWEKGRIVPLISRDVLLEYVRVLGYPKFALSTEDIKALLEEQVLPFSEMVSVSRTIPVVAEDPGDDKFLALAVAGRAKFLISGDIHLLGLERYRGIEIVTPRNFIARVGPPED